MIPPFFNYFYLNINNTRAFSSINVKNYKMEKRQATESGLQLLSRLITKIRPSLTDLSPEIFPKDRPKLKELIEISGESNIGKTIHLMELIAITVTPTEFGGKGASVIIIDTKSDFHVPFLLPRILEKHLMHAPMAAHTSTDTESLQPMAENTQAFIQSCLKRIMIYKCYTQTELDLVLLDCAELLTTDMSISLLAIDSIASFYWCNLRDVPIRMETYLKDLQNRLRKLANEFGIVVAYTKPTQFGGTSSNPPNNSIEYKVQLKFIGKQIFEARLWHESETKTRNYSINKFGIEWISSTNK